MTEQLTPFARWQRAAPKVRSTAIIAKVLGVSRQRAQHWLDGRSEPRLHVLMQLCALTGLAPDNFIITSESKALKRTKVAA